ncbi:hypothetical protein TVAG_001880 [Trichomonas vaginalis G3]|uniref:Uncharacterized protein n=1 Tax=Trichomonas vaginalis (strain ATCC PRA-98 / G3) TaxID=412133 RepID=A2FTX3_TRIV3|nr:hypothetical protein TVAGG3_0130280 [Trichomonas vaginalis G3]EAX91636.1 hypothetical protein TVAG_001880 [Trichomonas vaginalis G3]KAI5546048.1 hypothetical protein TVAGG3_0130280 [Trichomonas vaginalis G3]|eukprot:XP_001304566.1 hypothetical protein [Trichomonas vaginalis G3]
MNKDNLVEQIFYTSKNMCGTWPVATLTEIALLCKQMSLKQRDLFVQQLFTGTQWQELENQSKLKIAQLLVSLKSFFYPDIYSSIQTQQDLIREAANTIENGKLSDSTKKVILSLITSPSQNK